MAKTKNKKAERLDEVPNLTVAGEFQKLLVNFSLDQFYFLAQILDVNIYEEDDVLSRQFARLESEMCEAYINLNNKDKKKIIKEMRKIVKANLKNGVD